MGNHVHFNLFALTYYRIAEQKANSIHVKGSTSPEEFIKMREDRDKTLSPPALLMPSILVNIGAGLIAIVLLTIVGKFPPPASNGVSYLTIPLSLKK